MEADWLYSKAQMMFSPTGNRGEKLSTVKLTAVQYGILFMMLGLVGWAVAVAGAAAWTTTASRPSRTASARCR